MDGNGFFREKDIRQIDIQIDRQIDRSIDIQRVYIYMDGLRIIFHIILCLHHKLCISTPSLYLSIHLSYLSMYMYKYIYMFIHKVFAASQKMIFFSIIKEIKSVFYYKGDGVHFLQRIFEVFEEKGFINSSSFVYVFYFVIEKRGGGPFSIL